MKKVFLTILLTAGALASVYAQCERDKGVLNKKGYQVLPQKGDCAIGIDANPFLNYAANLFRGGNAPVFAGYQGSFYNKYFVRDNQAVRMRLLIGFNSGTSKFEVQDDAAAALPTPDLEARVIDRYRLNQNLFGLFGGYEFRRGYGRLQGFIGGEAGFTIGGTKESFEWGNAFSSTNTTPTSVYDWTTGNAGPAGSRSLWVKSGTTFSVQMGLFSGVEYFFARKVSIGGELGLNLRLTGHTQGKINVESFDAGSGSAVSTVTKDALRSATELDFTTPVTGNIFLMFHF